ncbi:MAG: serine/threonine-protein phosphatase [Desulfobacteraceae bacterium]|nr:MAG: serine/threonine-protein phosphatase [Desulfobacteraceae bacterium]
MTGMEHLFVSCSDPGRVRQQNEDFAGHAINESVGAELFCVADGMGGYGSGDLASRAAVDALIQEFTSVASCDPAAAASIVSGFFSNSQLALRAVKGTNRISSMFGTTLSALILLESDVIYANVGDTRIYCFDGENLTQKSHDQTIVNGLLEKNQISIDEARAHPQKHVLTQAITGDEIPLEPFIRMEPLNRNHIFLICSDGLYNMVDEEFIRTVLKQSSIFKARDYLLKQAYANGATDNITFQIIKPFDDDMTVS